jgi:uncharacterized protein (TIGR02118 family)
MSTFKGISRRRALGVSVTGCALLVAGPMASVEAAERGVKLTVLYGTPKDPAAFEKYYAGPHTQIVRKVKGIKRIELAKSLPGADGAPPAFYRVTELYFSSIKQMEHVTSSDAFKKVVADVPNFASGGATVVVGHIE